MFMGNTHLVSLSTETAAAQRAHSAIAR